MGKRGGYHGVSPADKSINAMDKFIRKSERVQQSNEQSGKKISAEDLERQSLKEQLDYYNNRTEADIFDEKYPAYSYWTTKFDLNQVYTHVHLLTGLPNIKLCYRNRLLTKHRYVIWYQN